jgi:hypothetical protein
MWRWASDLPGARRARRAACALIVPLVERSRQRLGAIADATWSDPYIVGFMVMLITIIARMEAGKIGERALCLVQAKAWDEITARPGNIGEDVLLLSTAHNRDFESGCRNAIAFASLLLGSSLLSGHLAGGLREPSPDLRDATEPAAPAERDDITTAWEQFFEAHVATAPPSLYTIPGGVVL